jgi:hypothetical protein
MLGLVPKPDDYLTMDLKARLLLPVMAKIQELSEVTG